MRAVTTWTETRGNGEEVEVGGGMSCCVFDVCGFDSLGNNDCESDVLVKLSSGLLTRKS